MTAEEIWEAVRDELGGLRSELHSGFIEFAARLRQLELAVARLQERNSLRRDWLGPWYRALATALIAALVTAALTAAVVLVRLKP